VDAFAPPSPTALKPKVVIVGDSTAAEYGADRYPQMGWGQVLKCYLDDTVPVLDLARGGRSSKSFIAEGFFSDMIKAVEPGDVVLIQWGINDASRGRPERFVDPDEDFRNYLMTYVMAVRARNAHPVLLTPSPAVSFLDGKALDERAEYGAIVRQTAADARVPLIDVAAEGRALFDQLGERASRRLYLYYSPEDRVPRFPKGWADNVHFSEAGARTIAAIVARGLKGQGLSISHRVLDGTDPTRPQPVIGDARCAR
jgi:lysophospholipase L1-like esterase